ncbi:MAG: ABC transporter ATP-binding protein, partial [Bacilli bacterium]|nr:ABC transporter ATP-binding protein [Bacilli bacterium]
MENSIETKELKVGYDKLIVVPSFSMAIQKGKITSIIGANGCGKSTVLKAIGRVIPKEGGVVILNGKDTTELKTKEIARQMAILPQSPTAPMTLTVRELVAYGRFPYQKGFGRLSPEDKEAIEWALKSTGMDEFA